MSIDFVVELSESFKYVIVMIVVDSMSKQAHFISTHTTVIIERIVQLFLHNIWKLYSIS